MCNKIVSHTSLLGVPISGNNYSHVMKILRIWIKEKKSRVMCVVPVHLIMESKFNSSLMKVIQKADLVVPDGMMVVRLSKIYGNKNVRRVYGPELMLKMCGFAEKESLSVFLLGGKKGVSKGVLNFLKNKFPKLTISGIVDTPNRPFSDKKKKQIISEIKNNNPKFLFVGMGSPFQELLMGEFINELDGQIMVGVGAAFDYFSGRKKQAPKWIRSMGFEWLFRFSQNPIKFWKRYIIYNVFFVIMMTKQLWKDFIHA